MCYFCFWFFAGQRKLFLVSCLNVFVFGHSLLRERRNGSSLCTPLLEFLGLTKMKNIFGESGRLSRFGPSFRLSFKSLIVSVTSRHFEGILRLLPFE